MVIGHLLVTSEEKQGGEGPKVGLEVICTNFLVFGIKRKQNLMGKLGEVT